MKKNVVSFLILIFVFVSSITFASNDRVSMGYIYNSSKSHASIIDDTNGNINTVSPTCFDLTNNGHLEINSIFTPNYVEEMHARNVLVTPFLSNHWARKKAQAALKIPEVLADEIVTAIEKYNFDGVNVDLENLLVKDRDNLTNFIRILREKLPEGKILSIAVGANPNRLSNSWVAAYDYAGLAEYVDYLVLMAYDEHAAGGSEGPVASINFVEDSVKVMLESVSRDKIVLGMPLYGRFWKRNEDNGGEAIIEGQIEKIAKRYNVVPVYNQATGTATVTINVTEGDQKAYVNGRYLSAGTYTIYYENEASIVRKMKVMNDYGLRGAALWAVGNESDSFWNYYGREFNSLNYESEENATIRIEKEEAERKQVEFLEQQIVSDYYDTILRLALNMNVPTSHISVPKFSIKENNNYVLLNKQKEIKQQIVSERIINKQPKIVKKQEKFELSHIVKRETNENK